MSSARYGFYSYDPAKAYPAHLKPCPKIFLDRRHRPGHCWGRVLGTQDITDVIAAVGLLMTPARLRADSFAG